VCEEARDMATTTEGMVGPLSRGGRRLRILVAIASYGTRNLELLKSVIARYQSLIDFEVDITVVSESPKNPGSGVEVVVGLPIRNPWSLPFAHKQVFARCADRYDLFIYSEDDIGISEATIHAFLRISQVLRPDEIAGFLRYETDKTGDRHFPDFHGPFHWDPLSVCRRGEYTIAGFSNEHAGFYILTNTQLKAAIASGGYLREPWCGRYGMLETAATDPYTCCSFRKIICISDISNFLVHHLSNRYAGQVGCSASAFDEQIRVLLAIGSGQHPATSLLSSEPSGSGIRWAKRYDDPPDRRLMSCVPAEAKSILSIGCGYGALEAALLEDCKVVTTLPLDSVCGAIATRKGIEVVYGTLTQGLDALRGRRFDSIIVPDLLHLLKDVSSLLSCCASLLRTGGALLLAGPNFWYLPTVVNRFGPWSKQPGGPAFDRSGINEISPFTLRRRLKRFGLRVEPVVWRDPVARVSLSGSLKSEPWPIRLPRVAWNQLKRTAVLNGNDADPARLPHQALSFFGCVMAKTWILRARKL